METVSGVQLVFDKHALFVTFIVVQSIYGKKSVNLPLIATEGFSTVLDPAMYP